jgi:hypothetical protein
MTYRTEFINKFGFGLEYFLELRYVGFLNRIMDVFSRCVTHLTKVAFLLVHIYILCVALCLVYVVQHGSIISEEDGIFCIKYTQQRVF